MMTRSNIPIHPWHHLPARTALGSGQVQVWHLPLDDSIRSDESILSDEERARADRFRFPVHRLRFTASRCALRQLLAAATGKLPGRLTIGHGKNGKPFLNSADEDLFFNLSHSESDSLIALSRGREVGIDLETLLSKRSVQHVQEFLSDNERGVLAEKSGDELLLRIWTRKEAWLKATGHGLTDVLTRYDVSANWEQPSGVLADENGRPWRFFDLSIPGRFVATMVLEGEQLPASQQPRP
jgi:4'-phosphopantetheinyl transferase